MIKDVMVRLDGGSGDDARLAAATHIAEIFQSHITGLFFNVVPDEFNGANINQAAQPDGCSASAHARSISTAPEKAGRQERRRSRP